MGFGECRLMTLLGSFIRSPLGAFTETPLGARNGQIKEQAPYLVFVFIDEVRQEFTGRLDFGYVDRNGNDTPELTTIYDDHVEQYRTLQRERFSTSALVTTVMHIKQLQPSPGFFLKVVPQVRVVMAFSGVTPIFERQVFSTRPPQLDIMQATVLARLAELPDELGAPNILVIIDDSGSLRGDLDPTIDEFIEWLEFRRFQFQLRSVEVEGRASDLGGQFLDEQWVRRVAGSVASRITT